MKSVIFFDFDGTLYDISSVREMMFRIESDFLCEYARMSRNEAKNFMLSEKIITANPSEASSATECFIRMGISPEIWKVYRTKRFDFSCINPEKSVRQEIIEGFKIFGDVILLSSNTLSTIHEIMRRININPSIFSSITCSDTVTGKFSKREIFAGFIHDRDVLSIGDRYNTDILPLLQFGGRGVLVDGPQSLPHVLHDMKNGGLKEDADSYNYFLRV